jgi:hypothetical protein
MNEYETFQGKHIHFSLTIQAFFLIHFRTLESKFHATKFGLLFGRYAPTWGEMKEAR